MLVYLESNMTVGDLTGSRRLHDMDALRSFALLLGVLLHAAIPFGLIDFWPVQESYAYVTDPAENPYLYLIGAIHGFRMPIFFMISGFFTLMLCDSRGLRRLASHRLRRIGLPLLCCMFTVTPATLWLFSLDTFEPVWWPLAWFGGFAHLWFLWYLLLIVGLFMIMIRLGVKFNHKLWWLLIPTLFLPQYLMQDGQFGADTPLDVMPSPRLLAYYMIFFIFGAFMYRRHIIIRRRWSLLILPAMFVVFPVALVVQYDMPADAYFEGIREIGVMLIVTYTWTMCFGLMALFGMLASKERFWVRYISDASYWIYICHLPLMILVHMLILDWALNAHLKFALICGATVAVLLILYRYGVRYTLIGTTLNGPRPHTNKSRF